ncbi:MAG: diguanylate cyclase, partial [Candidatus Firestonebacteria bacterium]
MFITTFTYELVNQVVFPNVTVFQSHILAVLFSTFVATIVAYFILRKYHLLLQLIMGEVRERKAAEARLIQAREVEEQRAREAEEGRRILEALMEYIPEGIIIADAAGLKVRMASKYILEFSGLPEEKMGEILIKKDFLMPVCDEPLSCLRKHLISRSINEGRVVVNEECISKRLDGKITNFLVNSGPIKDKNGRVIGVVASLRDVTELKTAEELLRQKEYEFRTLVENSPDIIVRFDKNMRIIYINPAIERITREPRESILGKRYKEYVCGDEEKLYWDGIFQKILETGNEETVESSLNTILGKRYYNIRIVPEFDKENMIESIMFILRDITEQRSAQEHIKYLSFHDSLTGLYNRAYFEEEIKRLDVERELPISFIMGDVNNLKLTNDTFGHEEGDRLLADVAAVLKSSCRKGDIIARWGGDEFVILLPGTDYSYVKEVAKRIKNSCSKNYHTVIAPSVALGISSKEKGCFNIYKILREAEEKMYKNKVMEDSANKEAVISSLMNRLFEKNHGVKEHLERLEGLAEGFGQSLGFTQKQLSELI